MALNPAHLYKPDVAGNYWRFGDNAVWDNTSLDIRVDIALDDWTSGQNVTFLGKRAATNQFEFLLNAGAGDEFQLTIGGVASATRANGTHADGARVEVRATYDASDGTVHFYYRAGGTSDAWTESSEGATAAGAGGGSSGAEGIEIGSYGSGTSARHTQGKIYAVKVYSDLTETNLIFHAVPDEDNRSNGWKDISATGHTISATGGDSWTFVPTWNPDAYPILATAEAFWFAGDGNGDYGPSSINPWADLSGSNHHLVRGSGANNPGFNAVSGSVPANFDYTNDYHTRVDSADLDFALAESLTLLVWVSPDSTSGGRFVAGKKNSATGVDAGYTVYTPNNTLRFLVGDGTAISFTNNTTPVYVGGSTFYVMVGRRDVVADEIESFQDGTEHDGSGATDGSTATLANAQAFSVGASGGLGEPFDGQIAAVGVWRSALSDAQITALQNELTNFRVGAGANVSSLRLGMGMGF